MRICIVTVYDSINSGSYWQAFALGKIIKDLGHEVYYYKRNRKGASSSVIVQAKRIAGLVKKKKIQSAVEYIKKIKIFRIHSRDFCILDKRAYSKVDFFVLGSDTIWNMDEPYFVENRKVFWGDIFKGKPVLSYAGSIANTCMRELERDSFYSNCINTWKAISVRDIHTYTALKRLTDKQIMIACDPTLLLRKEDYLEMINDYIHENYIFMYLFEPLTRVQDNEILGFAKAHGLKIIGGTGRSISRVCDRYVVNSPYIFLQHMLCAKYVITDTYHGTAFSLNFNKNLVVIDRNKTKVKELLEAYRMLHRLIGHEKSLSAVLSDNPDYYNINMVLDKLRNVSLKYLRHAISKSSEEV